jgi:hypothetical protein
MNGEEENSYFVILKCSETKLLNKIYVNNERGHFGNEILMMKIANDVYR